MIRQTRCGLQEAYHDQSEMVETMREIGWTATDLARRLGLSDRSVRRYMTGQRGVPPNFGGLATASCHRLAISAACARRLARRPADLLMMVAGLSGEHELALKARQIRLNSASIPRGTDYVSKGKEAGLCQSNG